MNVLLCHILFRIYINFHINTSKPEEIVHYIESFGYVTLTFQTSLNWLLVIFFLKPK